MKAEVTRDHRPTAEIKSAEQIERALMLHPVVILWQVS